MNEKQEKEEKKKSAGSNPGKRASENFFFPLWCGPSNNKISSIMASFDNDIKKLKSTARVAVLIDMSGLIGLGLGNFMLK